MIEATRPTLSQEQPEDLGVFEGWDVYPMPVFVRIEASDVERTARWFTDALGFGIMFVGPVSNGQPMLAHVRGARYQDVLIVAAGTPSATERAPVQITFQALTDTAVDELAARAAEHGRIDGPRDTPWNTRDVTAFDPDGNPFVFTGRLTSVPSLEFDDMMNGSST